MVATLLVWVAVLAVVVPVGMAVLRLADPPHEGLQRLLLAGVVGLLAVGLALLALAMLVPLGSPIAYLAIGGAAAGSTWATRGELGRDLRLLTGVDAVGLATAAVVAAGWASRLVQNFDTGLYHYQAVKWLRELGLVPGAATFEIRFGFVSSWLPLTAPLDAGVLAGRAAGLMSGLLLLLLLGLWLDAARTLATSWNGRANMFLVLAAPLTVLASLLLAFVPSIAPDFAVLVVAVLVAWLLIDDHSGLALLLGVLVVAVKPSAAPILLVAGAAYLWRTRRFPTAMVLPAVAVAVTVLSANIVTSGCVLYPVGATCLEPDWGVTAARADHTAGLVVDWGRWDGAPPDGYGNEWISAWFRGRPFRGLLDAAMILGVGLLRSRHLRWVAALAVAGWTFTVLTAPSLRFNVGYLVVLVAALVTFAVPARVRGALIPAGCLLLVVLMVAPTALIAPNVLPPSANEHLGGTGPTPGYQCWAAPIPCR